jgi:hypothetical protein
MFKEKANFSLMKSLACLRPPLFFSLLIFMMTLSACCSVNFNSHDGFDFAFDDGTLITSIEFVESHRTRTFNNPTPHVTLNPADSISTYIINYDGGSGSIKLGYSNQLKYSDETGCNNEGGLEKVYHVYVISSTFSSVDISPINLANDNHIRIYK